MGKMKCLNPWDVQSKHVVLPDGISESLCAGEKRWGSLPPNILCETGNANNGHASETSYAIEGNVVDRVSAKNGKGWCENVSPTLNTQDRHAVCFQLCGDRDNPSVSTSEMAYCIPANPMSDRVQAVCIALEGNGARPSHMGKGFSEDGTMYTLNTIEQHSVCYAIDQQGGKSNVGVAENIMPTLCSDSHGTPHAVCYCVDCRNACLNEEVSITLQAKNLGGFSVNCTPPILRMNDEIICD